MINIVKNKEVEGVVAESQNVADRQKYNSFLCLQQLEQVEFNIGCRHRANNVNDCQNNHGQIQAAGFVVSPLDSL